VDWKEKRQKLMFRWSLVIGLILSLFWFIWYLVNGSIPVVTSLIWSENITYELPWSYSRLLDIVVYPLLAALTIYYFAQPSNRPNKPTDPFPYFFGPFAALVCTLALITCPFESMGASVSVAIVMLALVALFIRSVDVNEALNFYIISILTCGLLFGSIYGSIWTLVILLMAGLLLGVYFLIVTIFKSLKPFWNWLIVKENIKRSEV